MNKQAVNDGISYAYKALSEVGIAKEGKIEKTYRGQISSFGAAITTGSLKAAVAFFSNQGSSVVERQKINEAILKVLQKLGKADEKCKTLWNYVDESKDTEAVKKENIVNAAISVKLAMNLYTLKDRE